ncbi:hypothetical protein SDC9_194112 [bioreactor metagenome]|uniref:Uncharacterized protein n=1 Tax=bioreactor metagenome TaxID=1076179 RepID=A0A645IGN6_9ZZZZ
MISGVADIQNGHHDSGLARRGGGCAYSSLQKRHFSFQRGNGRIAQARVHMPFGFQIKQGGNIIGVVIFVGCALNNRQYAGLS